MENNETALAMPAIDKIFSFCGNNVRMRKVGNNVQVCVSDFAKAFPKKNLSAIVNSKQMQDYVASLSKIKNFSLPQLLEVTHGGATESHGTWAHELVALRIAQKLSPEFAIWVDERIKELFSVGITAMPHTVDELINNPDLLIGMCMKLKELRAANSTLADENRRQTALIEQKDAQIQKDAPKVSYFEAFMNSVYGSKAACIREVVKQAHIRSESEFIAWMIKKHILFRYGKDNKLQPYADYTSCFDLIDVYDPRNDWSGKQLKMNPFGKQKLVKRYHDEHPEAFYEQKQLFNM